MQTQPTITYHLIKKSLYLTRFVCLFERFMYMRLLLGAALSSDMFQKKTGRIFGKLPNVFETDDDISVVKYDNNGADDDWRLCRALEIIRKENINYKNLF